MAIRVGDESSLAKAEPGVGQAHRAGRHERNPLPEQPRREPRHVRRQEIRLPVQEIVGPCAGRPRPPAPGRKILQELDARPAGRAQPGDAQPGAEHPVQVLLLRPEVLAGPRHLEPQEIAVEGEARRRVGDRDGRVIDAEEEPPLRALPARVALAGGKLDQLEEVAVRIPEVEGLDPSGGGIPVRQALGARGGVFDAVLAQPGVGPLHVRDRDGDVLEPEVVGPRIRRKGEPPGRQVLGELQELFAEPEPHHPHAQAEDPREPLVVHSRHLAVGDALESQHLAEEGGGAVGVRDGEAHRRHRGHGGIAGERRPGEPEHQEPDGEGGRAPVRERAGPRAGADRDRVVVLHAGSPRPRPGSCSGRCSAARSRGGASRSARSGRRAAGSRSPPPAASRAAGR